jgi:hypothetical protein
MAALLGVGIGPQQVENSFSRDAAVVMHRQDREDRCQPPRHSGATIGPLIFESEASKYRNGKSLHVT